MSFSTMKLLNTVKSKYEAGEIVLADADRARIEAETKELIEKSLLNKEAGMAPEGFEELLGVLKGADADTAFQAVLDFMKDKGLVKGEPGMGMDPMEKGLGMGMGKDLMGKGPGMGMGLEKGLDKGLEMGMGLEKGLDKDPMGKGPGMGMGLEKGLDKGLEMGMEKDLHEKMESPAEEKLEELGKDKEGPEMGMSKELDMAVDKDKPSLDLGKEKEDGLGKDLPKPIRKEEPEKKEKDEKKDEKKPVDLRAAREKVLADAKMLKKEEDADEEEMDKVSEEEMGLKESSIYRVKVSSAGNIVVLHKDKGPVFHAVPNDKVKSNKTALRRAANKVAGWVKYEGVREACKKSGGRWVSAGVDEGIDFGGVELPAATKGVTEGGSTVMDTTLPEKKDTSLKEYEDDFAMEREKVTPETKVARFELVSKDSLDDAEVVHDMHPDRPTDSVLDESEFDHGKELEDSKSTAEEADFDFKAAEDKFKKLYANRARKEAEDMFLSYVGKFKRCMKVASTRMRLNHDVDPFKVAMADVLINEEGSIHFSDGVRYEGMEERDAVELIECIASEGHSKFIEHLFKKAEDLMDRSDEYIKDMESDIDNLVPVAVESGPRSARKQASISESLEDSNFELKVSAKAASTEQDFRESVRGLVNGGFRVGTQLNGINKAFNR